jgi:hypothetical protein
MIDEHPFPKLDLREFCRDSDRAHTKVWIHHDTHWIRSSTSSTDESTL